MMGFWNRVSAQFLWAMIPAVSAFLLFLVYLGFLIVLRKKLNREFDRNFLVTLKRRYLPLGLGLPHSLRRTQFYIWAVCNPSKANRAIPRQEYVHFDRRVSPETVRLARIAKRMSAVCGVLLLFSFLVFATCDVLGVKI